MMSKMEWKSLRLGDMCEVITGNTPKTSIKENYNSCDIPFYKPSDISENGISLLSQSENYVSNFSKNEVRLLPIGSLLVTCIGTIGKIGITSNPCCSNQQINALIPNEKIDAKFLAYSLLQKKEQLKHIANAPVVPIINKTQFSNFKVEIPISLSHQRHIAATLDKANKFIILYKKQLEELDALAESVFYELFGDPVKNEKGWEMVKMKECIYSIANGVSPVCENRAKRTNEHGVLKLSAVTSGSYNEKENKALPLGVSFNKKVEVFKGDLLMTRKNTFELVGMSAYVFSTIPSLMLPDIIFRINTNERIEKIYLWKLINNSCFRNKIKTLATGAAASMPNISKAKLNNLDLPLPPHSLQTHFATTIGKIEEQKTLVHKALKESEDLFQRLMQDLFHPT